MMRRGRIRVSSGWHALLWLGAGLLLWQGCSAPPPYEGRISLTRLDPTRRQCTQDVECNNLVYTGTCEKGAGAQSGICKVQKRDKCLNQGERRDCTLDDAKGICRAGTQLCQPPPFTDTLWGDCRPAQPSTTELCDGLDNDCNGAIDETFAQKGAPCTVGLGTCRREGRFVCDTPKSLACDATAGTPQTEACDGLDNDCDGTIDEDLQRACTKADYPAPDKFGIGTCTQAGTRRCEQGRWSTLCFGASLPQDEICDDGKDNDCDGTVDEGCDPCLPRVLRARLTGHTDTITQLAFNAKGTRLASSSLDGTLRLWDNLNQGKALGTLPLSPKAHSVAFSHTGAFLAAASGEKIALWDTTKPLGSQPGKELKGHTQTIRTLAFHPSRTQLASGAEDGTIRLWDAQSGQLLRTMTFSNPTIPLSIHYIQQGKSLIAIDASQFLYLWNTATGRLEQRWGHISPVTALATAPQGPYLAYASQDRLASLWNLQTFRYARSTPPQPHALFHLALSITGTTLATAHSDGSIQLWDTTRDPIAPKQPLTGPPHAALQVAFSPGQRTIAAAFANHNILLWRCP